MLQSEYDVIVRHKRLKALLIILAILAVALGLFFAIKVGREYLYKPTETVTGVAPKDTDMSSPRNYPEPQRTDFGMNLPVGFPIDIPIERDAKFTQSYRLDYPGQSQLSIVFLSTKSVKENFDLYKDYAEKHGWTVSNKDENEDISFLYGKKNGLDMSVVIESARVFASSMESTPSVTMDGLATQPDTIAEPQARLRSQVGVSILNR